MNTKMNTAATIRPALQDDWQGIVALLGASRLPTADLSAESSGDFLVADEAGFIVGAAAMVRYGEHGLLRSLAVDPAWQRCGLGRTLVDAAEDRARSAGVQSLTLLTQTASGFFGALGYREISRAGAPPLLQSSAQFTDLCPGSSTCMTKDLQ
jgi:amino-acid N-acetyltransferase